MRTIGKILWWVLAIPLVPIGILLVSVSAIMDRLTEELISKPMDKLEAWAWNVKNPTDEREQRYELRGGFGE